MMSKWSTHMEDRLLLYPEGPVSLAEGTLLGAACFPRMLGSRLLLEQVI